MAKDIKLSQFYVKHLMSNLHQQGINTDSYAPRKHWGLKINALTVPLSDFLGLCELARKELGDPLFSMRVASRTLPPSHGVLGLLLQSCDSVGEVIHLGYKYQHLTRTGLLSTLTFDGDTVTSRLDGGDFDPEVLAPFVEYCHGNLYSIASYLTGHMESIEALEIHFRHKPRAPLKSYQHLLHCKKILFNQAENQVTFSRKLMDLPVYLSDGSAKKQLLSEANRQLGEVNQANSLSEQIKQHLQQREPFELLSLDECARHLNISSSTLKRRLAEENLSYRQLLDAVREDLACHYLRAPDFTIEEIGKRVGFSNTATFSRAFKRWRGQSPQQYRQFHSSR